MKLAIYLFWNLVIALTLSLSLNAQTPQEKTSPLIKEMSERYEKFREECRKAQEELEKKPPEIEVSVVVDDKEISEKEPFEFQIFQGKDKLIPISRKGRVFVFQRVEGDQSIFVSYKRWSLRDFFMNLPELVQRRIKRLYVLTISPQTAYEGVVGNRIWWE